MNYRYAVMMLLIVLCFACSVVAEPARSCPGKNKPIAPSSIEGFLDSFAACLEAQSSIGNPLLDSQTGRFHERFIEDYFVELRLIPQHRHYYIAS